MNRRQMKDTVDIVYNKIFNEGKVELFPALVTRPYIQHSPMFPDEPEAIMGYVKQVGRIPCEVKRVAIDGDLAFCHVRYLNLEGREYAGVDIFRFDADGKIVEHWDVLQPVPTEAANSNGMF